MPGKSGNCLKETRVFRLNGSFQETGAGVIVDCGLVHGGMIVVVHCGETTSSPFFWNLPGSWSGIFRQTQKVNIARRRKIIQSLFGLRGLSVRLITSKRVSEINC